MMWLQKTEHSTASAAKIEHVPKRVERASDLFNKEPNIVRQHFADFEKPLSVQRTVDTVTQSRRRDGDTGNVGLQISFSPLREPQLPSEADVAQYFA